jgi:hypothetical protein
VSGSAHQTLAVHLEGIHKALLSLVVHLEDADDAREVRARLEWSASHLRAAIRELAGEGEKSAAGVHAGEAELEEARRNAPSEGLRGHTQAISIPEVLGFVASLRKSGVLRVKTPDEAFLIQLDQGEVIYAVGDNPPEGEQLGELLISRGQLCIADLEEVLADGVGEGAMLGSALVAAGKVGAEALRAALQHQVQSIFHRVFGADDAVYQFDEGVAMRVPADIRLNVTKLLLESARTSDEGLRRVG